MLTSRELASVIWLGVMAVGLLLLVVRDRDLGKSLVDMVLLLLRPPLSLVILGFFLWVALCVVVMERLGVWEADLLRETVLWGVVSGMALVFSASKAGHDPAHFRKAIRRTFEVTVLIEFLFGLVSFPLVVELIAQPALLALVLCKVVAKSDEKHAAAASCIGVLLAVAGFGFMVGTLALVWVERGSIQWADQLLTLGMLVWLPLLCLPYVYVLAWGTEYGAVIRSTKWQLEKSQSGSRRVGPRVRLALAVGLAADLHVLRQARLPVARDLARSAHSFPECLDVIRVHRRRVQADRASRGHVSEPPGQRT